VLIPRSIEVAYQDPLDIIWIRAALDLGIQVRRDPAVFASWDGASTLTIGTGDTLDPDDSLAQLIFHELCHAMVEGSDAFLRPDWGLENVDDRDAIREHACLRLQATLAAPHGLRSLLAATTDYRAYYDALPDDPMIEDSDPAIPVARQGLDRARNPPWRDPVQRALTATARILDVVGEFASVGSIWRLPQ